MTGGSQHLETYASYADDIPVLHVPDVLGGLLELVSEIAAVGGCPTDLGDVCRCQVGRYMPLPGHEGIAHHVVEVSVCLDYHPRMQMIFLYEFHQSVPLRLLDAARVNYRALAVLIVKHIAAGTQVVEIECMYHVAKIAKIYVFLHKDQAKKTHAHSGSR